MRTRFKLISFAGAAIGFALLLFILYDIRATYIKVGEFKRELTEIKASVKSYKDDINAVTQISINILAELDNEKIKNTQLYNDVANGIIELHIKTDNLSRDTATATIVNEKTARLAESVRQDYFNLREQITANNAMIIGWQHYYCSVIAPKNNTEFMCKQVK